MDFHYNIKYILLNVIMMWFCNDLADTVNINDFDFLDCLKTRQCDIQDILVVCKFKFGEIYVFLNYL